MYLAGTNDETLILLHGTGGDAAHLVPIARLLAPHAALLGIDGRVFENGQRRYFRHRQDWQFDLADLASQSDWLLTTIGEKMQAARRAPAQATVIGYSNGANIAAYAMLTRAVPWRDAVLFHPTAIAAPRSLRQPLEKAAVWLSHGSGDLYADEENFASLQRSFDDAQATVTTYLHQRGHQLTHAEMLAAKDWYSRRHS